MNKLIISVALAMTMAAPALSFAESTAPVTHASLLAQIAQLEKVGYNPSESDPNYPSDLQAAEAKVAMQEQANASVGGVPMNTQSDSGAPVSTN